MSCGVGLSYSSDSTPSLGTCICCKCGPEKETKRKWSAGAGVRKPVFRFCLCLLAALQCSVSSAPGVWVSCMRSGLVVLDGLSLSWLLSLRLRVVQCQDCHQGSGVFAAASEKQMFTWLHFVVLQVQLVGLDEESSEFICRNTFDHPYPTTKLMWIPDTKGVYPDLLATSGDYLRVWRVSRCLTGSQSTRAFSVSAVVSSEAS